MKVNFLIVLAFLGGGIPGLFGQGMFDGFSKGKGNLDLALTASYQTSQKYVAGFNTIVYPRSQAIANLYGAYGISDRLDVAASLPFVYDRFQDFSVGAKYAFLQFEKNDFQFSSFAAFSASVPTHNYPTEIKFAVGQRAVVLAPRFITQLHHASGLFVQGQIGYNQALNPVPSSASFSAKLGWHGAHLYTDVWYDQQIGKGNKDFLGSVPYDSFRELTYSYQRVGATVYAGFGNWGVSLNYSHILTIRNGWLYSSTSLGVIRKLKF